MKTFQGKPMSEYEIIVGNIGMVYTGVSLIDALATYADYVELSESDYGRASGEDVTMFKDGEIHREHIGTLNDDQ